MTLSYRREIAELALRKRLPAISAATVFADAGLLMSYGPDLAALFRRAAVFVDKILKGARPGDIPVEQPTRFELVINLKTAKALGVTLPPSLLLRADRVVE
jgi:putative ABC transport system substrate-binding protein